MSDRKGQSDSRQKKADAEDGKLSVDSKKKSELKNSSSKWGDSLKRVKSAKSSKSMIKTDELGREKSSLSLERKKSSLERKKSATVGRLSGVERDKSSLSLERQKSSTGRKKSATRLSGVERDRSSISLERQKSSTGRKKSATRLSNNSKTVRKFIGKIKPDKAGADDDDEEGKPEGTKLLNGKIWDEKIEKLALRRKRVSLIDREIGLRQIRIIPPTPTIQNIGVRKSIVRKPGVQDAMVMKPAGAGYVPIYPTYTGPRYDQLGKIIPHSILGDVESFLQLSGQAAKVSNILLVHASDRQPAIRGSKSVEENMLMLNPLLNQKNALNTWKMEMELRCKEQNRLAGLLKRNERCLLMCKSETKADKEIGTILQYGDWRNQPDVCFWKLPQKITAGHLQETLSKSGRGQLPTPVVSGDADTILQEKSKVHEADLCKRYNDDSAQERIESVKGTIQIANKVLFDNLLVQGEPIKTSEDALGDGLEQCRGVRFYTENDTNDDDEGGDVAEKLGAMFSKFFGARRMSKVVRDTRDLMKFKGISADLDEEVCGRHGSGFGDRSKRRQSTYNEIVMSEQMNMASSNFCKPALDIRFVGLEKEEVDGPALLVDGTTLQWCDCSVSGDDGCHGDGVLKEVLILIKGEANCMTRGYAKLENIGSTVIRYSWLRVGENKLLPVPRPRRRFFYFLDDEGVVLPRETVYVPMLFRSMVPGYFTESWLLATQPQLEGGAKVKFTFKAIARYEPDFSKQYQDIEDYLRMNETRTICSLQAQSILDYSTLKASLAQTPIIKHPEDESTASVFMKNNPGLYFYSHIVKRLELLSETYIALSDIEMIENGDIVVSVTDLWKAFYALPDDDDDDSVDDESDDCDDESYVNLTRKQTLLWELYYDCFTLSFQPVLVIQSSYHSKYILMYTLLQAGVDRVVNYAQNLADNLGLVYKKEAKDPESVQKQEKRKLKGKASKVSKKGQSPEQISPAPTVSQEPPKEIYEFSAAQKFRAENKGQHSPILAKYDEKVYLEMYSMLTSTIEEMSVLFENM